LRAGEVVLEILPTGSKLIAEAKVSPADIAFVSLGQAATVSLDAYDSAIFGSLVGEVVYISADTLKDEQRQGTQTYYRVHVQIKGHTYQGERAHKIEMRPGMTASVSIKSAERSVLSYLTKPITKTLSQSLGEH
jgi:adhesin transport system membrane fusion protein